MAQLITQNISLTVASPTFQFDGTLSGNLADMIVNCFRLASPTPFPAGEVREVTGDLLLSTDGGVTYVDQGGVDWVDGIQDSQEPSGTTCYVTVAKGPNRRIRVIVTLIRGSAINLSCTISAN